MKKLKIHSVKIQDLKNEFTFTTGPNKLERSVTKLSNLKYNEIKNKYNPYNSSTNQYKCTILTQKTITISYYTGSE